MGREWSTPVDMEQYYDEEENRLYVTVYLLKKNRIKPDRILTMYLCPEGQVCGCFYSAAVGWEIQDILCTTLLSWQWPAEAG